jgi:hypothetical protein
MKKLKLLLLTLISVISFGVMSQTMVYTSPTSGPNICDGTAVLDTSINLSVINWNGFGTVIQSGGYYVDSLCPGTYTVSFVVNNTPTTLTFNITSGTFNPCLNFGGYITTIDSTINDGSMTANVINGTAPYTYQWSNGNMLQTINNLPVGGYCCYVMDANGCNTTLCDSIVTQSINFGDTLVLNSTGTCNSPIGNFTTTIEDCNINFNTIDTAYMTINGLINSGLDSILCVWYVIDTTGTYQTYMVNYPMIDSTGCYNFQLVVYCYTKSMDYKTIVINQTESIGFAGIEELTQLEKTIVKITDMLGRECKPESGELHIIRYSDGSTEKVIRN